MYTICYVLADSEELFYYNQLLISLCSLRKKGNNGRVCVLMDSETAQCLERKNKRELDEFNAESIIIHIPDEYSQKEKSRYMKTSLRKHLKGDILYIDTDTVIVEHLPSVVSNTDLAMVCDGNENSNNAYDNDYIHALFKKCGYNLDLQFSYFNTGVIWIADTGKTHLFFERWHEEWENCRKHGVTQDQPSANHVNSILDGMIAKISDAWNVQINFIMGLRYLDNALIVHYFNTPWESLRSIYTLSNREIQKKDIRIKKYRA